MKTLAEKRCLNLFEVAMTMLMLEQTIPPGYALAIINEETGKSMEYHHLTKYSNKEIQERRRISFANEIGNLAQGVGGCVKGTGTIYFIKRKYIMSDQKATYGQTVVYYLS